MTGQTVPDLPEVAGGKYVDDGWQEELASGDDNGYRIGTFIEN